MIIHQTSRLATISAKATTSGTAVFLLDNLSIEIEIGHKPKQNRYYDLGDISDTTSKFSISEYRADAEPYNLFKSCSIVSGKLTPFNGSLYDDEVLTIKAVYDALTKLVKSPPVKTYLNSLKASVFDSNKPETIQKRSFEYTGFKLDDFVNLCDDVEICVDCLDWFMPKQFVDAMTDGKNEVIVLTNMDMMQDLIAVMTKERLERFTADFTQIKQKDLVNKLSTAAKRLV